ncbi:MAG: hypothetical protein DWQ01_04575 [Planctomycetota bacterium]|nr:MAG: hypothetical protein DWQ01_04575 [Planctomycetota bacterium]
MKFGLPFLWFSLLATATPLAAQAIEDPGPHAVGWRDVLFDDQIFQQGSISARIFYPALQAGKDTPADPSGGPFPLIGFQHGWLGSPDDYDELCTHLASWGFLVASTGTETGLFPNHAQYARDTRSLLHWVDAASQTSGSWLQDMSWDGPWAASGHSMGGGVLARLIGIENRIEVIVGLQSASQSGSEPLQNMQSFSGRAYQIAGSEDWIVPPAVVYDWFANADAALRNQFYQVEGMGHTGCTDTPSIFETMPPAEQKRLHRRLLTGLLRFEMLGHFELLPDLFGEGIQIEPVVYQADHEMPVFWADESRNGSGDLAVGLAARNGERALMAWSLVPAAQQTAYGLLGLDPASLVVFSDTVLPLGGKVREILPTQPAWSGQPLYLQGLSIGVNNTQLSATRTLNIP